MTETPKIYLIRHGQTEWSLSGRHTGLTDIALTEEGKREGACLCLALKGVSFEAVYSSPLKRATETACLAKFSNKIIEEPDLVEFNYGDYEGRRTVDIVKENPRWNLFQAGAPGGETLANAGERADRVIAKIRSHHGNVALISHGHFLRILAARWLGVPPQSGRFLLLSTASISILGYEHNLQEPAIHLWNSTSHLSIKSHLF